MVAIIREAKELTHLHRSKHLLARDQERGPFPVVGLPKIAGKVLVRAFAAI